MLKDLYFSNKTKKYYYLGVIPCNNCYQLINYILFIERNFSNKAKTTRYFCKNCISNRKEIPKKYSDIIMCLVVDEIPKDAFPVFDSNPVLSNFKGEETVFEMTKNFSGERIIDKTIQSHNKDFMIMDKISSEHKLLEDIKNKKLFHADKLDFMLDYFKNCVLLDERFSLEDSQNLEYLKSKINELEYIESKKNG